VRQPGQGGAADREVRDLRAELLAAEAAARAKKQGGRTSSDEPEAPSHNKRAIEDTTANDGDAEDEDVEAKRRRILEETRDIDADSDGGGGGSDESSSEEESDDDDEDETAELLRELEKIKRERAEQREKEEREKREKEEAQREFDIARGNPLLNPKSTADFSVKRRWDDDVIFKNQARGTDDRNKKKEFVNDLLRSDFHKKFMVSIHSPWCTRALTDWKCAEQVCAIDSDSKLDGLVEVSVIIASVSFFLDIYGCPSHRVCATHSLFSQSSYSNCTSPSLCKPFGTCSPVNLQSPSQSAFVHPSNPCGKYVSTSNSVSILVSSTLCAAGCCRAAL
jgi:protein CWC15